MAEPARTLGEWLGWALALVVVDQVTKLLILQGLLPGQVVALAPFLNLVLVYNPGAAFSLLADAAGWQRVFFIAVAIVAIAWIIHMLRADPGRTRYCAALTLILGGAAGNLIDRLWLGAVIDFIDLHAGGWHWPAFNVADSAICCGAALLVWDALRPQHDAGSGREPAPPAN
ncbi:MAG: signal peptidase II [Pseudomonadota bacterium]|jgi:signal peptidase II